LAWPIYGIGAIMIVSPLVDLAANVWPPRLGQLAWRFGTAGLVSGFLLTPVFGIVMLGLSAALLDHRIAQRILAVLNVCVAIGLIALVVIFGLDWLQFRATVPPEGRPTMDLGSLKAMGTDAVVALMLLWLGFVGWRVSRKHPGDRGRRPAPLIREPDQPAS